MDSNLSSLITDTANRYGEDPSTALRIAEIESHGRNVDNPRSGAAGIYQFTPGTWSAYGNGSDPHDVASNVDAGVRLMRDNRAALERSLGRLPSAGEVYLAHQQGHAGASALLSNPDGNAAQVLASAYHGNVAKAAAAISANGGDPNGTAGQFAHKWTSAVDGHAPIAADGGSGFTPRTVSYSDLMAPQGSSFGPQHQDDAPALDEAHPDFDSRDAQLGADYFKTNNLTASALRRTFLDPSFAPDPNFAPTSDDIKRYATGPDGSMLPPEYLSRFASATSDAQARWIADRSREEVEIGKKVDSLGNGWNAMGIKAATMLLDPVSLGIGAATDGLLSPATSALARFGMAGRIASGAMVGGASNVAITAAQRAVDGDPVLSSDAGYLNALAMGMTLGGAFGPLARGHAPSPTEAPPLANATVAAGKSLRKYAADHAEERTAPAVKAAPADLATTADSAEARPAAAFNAPFIPGPAANDAARPIVSFADLDRYAATTDHAPLYADVSRLDGDIASARRTLAEMKPPMKLAPPALSETAFTARIAALQEEAASFTGKRRSSPAAKAAQAELAEMVEKERQFLVERDGAYASTNADAKARAADTEASLRLRLNDLQQQRAALGPRVRAAREAAARKLGIDLDAVADNVPTPNGFSIGDYNRWAAEGRLPRTDTGAILTAANDPWEFPAAAPGGGGPANLSVGAAHDPFAHTPLELKTGAWGDVRDEGQYRSNLAVDDKVPAWASNIVLPATGTQTASSPFAEHRMFGAFLAGNPLGYAAEANPVDAALAKTHIRDEMIGRMNRFLKPAFDEWATRQGYGNLERMAKRPEFMGQAHDYLTKANPGATYDPAVMRYVDQGVRPIYQAIAAELNRTGIAEDLTHSADYFPRLFDPNKVGTAYQEFGAGVMAMAAKEAIREMPWAAELAPDRLDTISRGYVSGIAKRAMDLDDAGRALTGRDLDRLHAVLTEDAGLGREEANAIVDRMHRLTDDPTAGSARLKDRVDLDISKRVTLPDGRSLSLGDMVSKDVGFITERYVDQMAGRLALADMHVVDPSTGETLLQGIKSDGDFTKALGDMRRNIQERYLDKAATVGERKNLEAWRDAGEANLRFMYDRIMSKPMNPAPGAVGRSLRLLRKYTFTRMMGGTGWSHASIFASNIGNGGLRAITQQLPAFRHIMSQDGEWIMAHGLDRELEAMFGNSTDPLRGLQMQDWGTDPAVGASRMDRAERVLDQMSKATAIASGLSHIVDMNTRWARKIIAQKFADMAYGARELEDGTLSASGANMKRMRSLGLDEADLQKVLREVKANAFTERGILFDHKLTKLNLNKWDQETAYKFQAAIARYTGRVVQENDVASSARWISNPAWQLFMQFRNFPMVGMTKQLTYNLVMHDREAGQYAMTALAMGALTYYAKEQVNSIGRSDRDDYLAKRLAPQEIMRAMAHHSGLFGLMPAFIDTGARMAGADPLFDYRSSGNPSALWAAPGLSTLDDASKATAAVWRPFAEHRTRSQAEARALIRMLPFNNITAATLLTNAMVSGLPAHAPSAGGFDR